MLGLLKIYLSVRLAYLPENERPFREFPVWKELLKLLFACKKCLGTHISKGLIRLGSPYIIRRVWFLILKSF